MGILSPLSIIHLLWAAMVFCQYEDYDFEDEYDEPDHQHPYYFNPNIQVEVPHFPFPVECAKECFCPPAFLLSMYCDHRKLKAVPNIPSHIQQLYLQNNDIEAVPAGPFTNGTFLREINLSHNKIKSPMIDHGVFAKLSNLVQLHLQHNELEEFPFPLPSSLERLLLGFNKISQLSGEALEGLPNITMLDLCNNFLDDSVLKGKPFSNTKNLMQLHLCNNRLQTMPPDLPSSLMYLSLENNSISYIPENYFNRLPKIIALRMSHNNLQNIARNTFNLPNLLELNLGHNKLKQVFYIPRSLQHLYLEDNDIEMINVTLMCPSIDPMNSKQLTYIRVDQNKLTIPISTYAFFCFPHIQAIYYGEQNVNKSTQLRIPVFRRFLTPEEYDEAEDYLEIYDHETEEDHEAEDNYFRHYFQ
ncbi:PREDICTED: osteomodulin [Merops nubicus]|uniref:osteomodulin n=1 Tax=Merops nubicus TaxID=57421 RepID=UPI0004F02229|nr:PREDICTED: osteomodulin [Merops nubicus]